MEKVNWKVEGMSCSNCVLTIGKYLEKKGLQDIEINLIGGDVSFGINGDIAAPELVKGIESLGYQVDTGAGKPAAQPKRFLSTHFQKFLFCLVFTVPLL